MKFLLIAQCFSALEHTSSRLEMTELLAALLKQSSASEAAIICNISLGQLNPPYIGTQFNIAEKTMVKVLAKHLGIGESTVKEKSKKCGDLGSVLDEYTWQAATEMTVHQVFDALHTIEKVGGTGSQEEKSDLLIALFANLDPVSAKYVVRIILGKLRLGFSDMTIVDALSWMEVGNKSLRGKVEDAYNLCADIGYIASLMKEKGSAALAHMHVVLGIPIRPAAAERMPTAQAIMEKLGPCVAQPKLDGFRLQIHLDKTHKEPKIHFFSRNLQDMSAMFPDLTAAIAQLNVTSLICEGEAIVYEANSDTFLPFQETVKRKRKHDIEEAMVALPLHVFLFDILYLDGKSLIDMPHDKRRHLLLKIANGAPEIVHVDAERQINTIQELQDYFAEVISAGLEGLVVKKPDAIYQPGKRNFNWIKLKREEQGHLEDTIDCVVLGYYGGRGKRAGFGIGALLVGIYNKDEDRFETIAKIGTGLKDYDWHDIKKRCDALKVLHQPHNVVCANALYPDVWIAPEMVVMIRADEITLSPLHKAGKTEDHLGYALRFPRFMGYRLDKKATDATQVLEIVQLYNDQFKR